jgi:FkbM family methyltransferase
MAASRRLPRVLLRRGVPLRTRASLLAAALRRRLRPKVIYDVRYGRGALPITHDDYPVDWETLKAIVVDRIYELDYSQAVVLDIGSHKGYFGAFALERGARTVISLEPESANFRLLERCAASYRHHGADWQLRRAAVGAEAGEVELHVMNASWGHALEPPADWAAYEVGTERVPLVAMSELLAEAGALVQGSAPLVVKINAEGAECAMVLRTAPESWRPATHAFVAVHSWAGCTAAELAGHLSLAGLARRAAGGAEQILVLSR